MPTALDSEFTLYWVMGPGAGQIIELPPATLSIGRIPRDQDGWLKIDDQSVSRHHADLVWLPSKGRFLYRHHSKTNPSRVEGMLVTEDIELGDSSHIGIGKSQFLLQHRWAGKNSETGDLDHRFEFVTQLLPGGYTESLKTDEENRLGIHLCIHWEPRWNCFMAMTDGEYIATLLRRCDSHTYKLPFSRPTALEPGDILEADFCQHLFTRREAQNGGKSSLNSLRNAKSLIPGYRRIKKLGQGNSSEVFLMLDPYGRKVAAKFLLPHLVHESEARMSFAREGQVALTLNHPFLLDVLHVGTNDAEEKYIVSEFMEQGSLRQVLDDIGTVKVPDALRLARDVAAGLNFLHERNLVHRDVKPSNIFLSGTRCVVADFGIVRGVDAETATQSGYTHGTPQYMAPEHFRGVTEQRSDQYALAIVLIEAMSGHLLFDAPDNMTTAHKHLHESPDRLEELVPDISPNFRSGLKRMLAKSPEKRFPTVLEAVAFLSES